MSPHNGLLESRIRAAQAGSIEALGELLEGCRQYLLLVANQELHGDLHAKIGASDLVQETFLDAQRGFERFDGGSERDLLAWLRQILLNNLRDVTRSFRCAAKRDVDRELPFVEANESATTSLSALPGAGESPSWCVRQVERRAAIQYALTRLSHDHREAIVLRNLELQSFIEIGRRMGRSPAAARKLWSRAIQALVEQLGETDVL
jgi:RNA polymerase sigma-70 factor (ECF subfamily)